MGASLILLSAVPVHSQIVFDYVKIADTTTPIPNGTGNFGGFTVPANTGSNVAFYGIGDGSQIPNPSGMYRSAGGVLMPIVDRSTPVPGDFGTGSFGNIGYPSVRGTEVVFQGVANSGVLTIQDGIYRSGGGALEVIADRRTPIPFGTQRFVTFSPLLSASGGLTAFSGGNNAFGQGGIYVANGASLHRVIDFSTPIPSGTSNFTGWGTPSIDGDTVAFRGFRGSGATRQEGIYLESTGTLSRVADTNTAIPSGTGRFTSFGDPTAQGGRVAFRGLGASAQIGLYVANGGTLSRIANTSTPIPAGTGNFTAVANPSLDGQDVAFIGARTSPSQSGIYLYTGLNGTFHKVVDKNSVLGGSRVDFLNLGPEGLSGGSIVFYAMFTDGKVGLWVALRNYTLFSATNGSWDVPTNWAFGQIPGTNVPVIINPGVGLTLMGPAAATQVHSLIVSNSGAAPTILQLQNSGPLTAAQGVIIGVNGILAGNGSLALGSNATVQIVGSVSALAAISPGASLGTLALGTAGRSNRVVFGNHSELRVEINQAGQSDQLAINGHLDLSSDLDALNISVTDSASGDYTLVTYSGTRTGTFNTVTGLPSGYSVDYSQPGQIILKAGQSDTDSDGIPDAFELQYATNLTVLSATGDADGDGQTDVGEYIADTNPLDPASRLEVTDSSFTLIQNERRVSITWTSGLACRYRIEETTTLSGSWGIVLDNIVPDAGAVTTRSFMRQATSGGFFRVRASRSAGQ